MGCRETRLGNQMAKIVIGENRRTVSLYATKPRGVNTSFRSETSENAQPHTLREGLGRVWQVRLVWVQSCERENKFSSSGLDRMRRAGSSPHDHQHLI